MIKLLGYALVIANLFYQTKVYNLEYYPRQINNQFPTKNIVKIINSNTKKRSQFIMIGNDWNADVAYYSKRKCLALMDHFKEKDTSELINILQSGNDSDLLVVKKNIGGTRFRNYYNRLFKSRIFF